MTLEHYYLLLTTTDAEDTVISPLSRAIVQVYKGEGVENRSDKSDHLKNEIWEIYDYLMQACNSHSHHHGYGLFIARFLSKTIHRLQSRFKLRNLFGFLFL